MAAVRGAPQGPLRKKGGAPGAPHFYIDLSGGPRGPRYKNRFFYWFFIDFYRDFIGILYKML